MRLRFLDLACCPECLGQLNVDWREPAHGDEIESGALRCAQCARQFPVIGSIPRLLPDALAPQTLRYHAEFVARHSQQLTAFIERAGGSGAEESRWWADERRTLRSYSYQWRKFKEMFPHWEEVFVDTVKPITPEFFAGKVGLDGGCGFGRSIFYAATFGAEMIGLDLSEAIEAARENTRHLPNVHLVQGDIFHPPVRRQALDFVYSIGVLHHLPDPKGGFLSLSRLLKPGAPMFIWVYLRGRGRQIKVFNVMRAISTRMPLRLLNAACLGLAVGQYAAFVGPRKALEAIGAPSLGAHIPFSFYARYPFRTLHADWFDGLAVPLQNYYKPHEIAEWYREGGFERVHILDERQWNGRALGYAPVTPQSG
jgi:SAM-dependent methyltransferase